MKFFYERYTVGSPSNGMGVMELYRPEILVRVIGKKDDAFLLGLLDTGADEVLMPRSIAEIIGVELESKKAWRIAGFAGHTLHAFLGRADFEVIDSNETIRWSATVGVVDYQDPGEQTLILGRNGFLQFFNAEFRGADFEIELQPNGTFPKL